MTPLRKMVSTNSVAFALPLAMSNSDAGNRRARGQCNSHVRSLYLIANSLSVRYSGTGST